MIRYPRFVLGVDPGSRSLGWCLLKFANLSTCTVEGFGTILGRDGDPLHRRFGKILDELSPIIARAKSFFAEAVVERPFVNENYMATLAIAGVRGIALGLIGLAGLRFSEYGPSQWKTVVGDGRASPEKYSYILPRLLKLREDRMPFDAAAAAGLALYHGTRVDLTDL